jgi:hypothetical protein
MPGSGLAGGRIYSGRRIMSSTGKAMAAIELIQSMRIGTFGDFVVMGSPYSDVAGDRLWYIALLTGPEPVANIHHVIAGELPDEPTIDERDAVIEAIRLWESQALSRPN